MFSSLEEVQVYLKRNCPKKCPVCESKVKRYRIGDANDQDEKYIMCKNKEVLFQFLCLVLEYFSNFVLVVSLAHELKSKIERRIPLPRR